MAEARNLKKAGTGKSALGLLAIAAAMIVIGIVAYYALSQSGVLDSLVNVLAIAAVVVIAVVVIVYVVMAVIALPMYVHKGETYQENVDYSLDDIESVGEKTDKDGRPKD